MFTISPALMQQCIDMVAKEQDYIYPADGIDENYSVVNWGDDGVWIVYNLDDSKVQQIVLPEQQEGETFYIIYTPLSGNKLQPRRIVGCCYCSREEAEATYQACGKHIPVVMYSYVYGGVMHEVKRNY